MKNTLFDLKILESRIANDDSLNAIIPSENDLFKWFVRIKTQDERLVSEMRGYGLFQFTFLEHILGYNDNNIETNAGEGREKVEFALKKEGDNHPFVVIELKGLGTNLRKPAKRGDKLESPIDQARNYARNQRAHYCIASDYNKFVFFPYSEPDNIFFEITFDELFVKKENTPEIDEEELEELKNKSEEEKIRFFKTKYEIDHHKLLIFLAVFHKQFLLERKLIDELRQEGIRQSEELTKEFYRLVHETRLQIIWELMTLDPEQFDDISKAIHVAQLILNRWLFICFAENRVNQNLLPYNITFRTLETPIVELRLNELTNDELWRELNKLFIALKQGDRVHDLFAYNGGLFEEELSEISIRDLLNATDYKQITKYSGNNKRRNDPLANREDLQDALKRYRGLDLFVNPIFLNLLRIASYDFQNQVTVDILGRIFEQSITDIESLLKKGKSGGGKRKSQGIFYTPEFITDYITRQAIYQHLLIAIGLAHSGQGLTARTIINMYLDNGRSLEELEERVKNIKVLDPACGSGAFLNKAVDVLLELHQYIREAKEQLELLSDEQDHISLDAWLTDLTNEILLNNLYGVDINEESVQITKLSLFLKIIDKKKQKLPVLDENIKVGDSLISNPDQSPLAFQWENEFPFTFHVVIGNPPYVRIQNLPKEIKEIIKNNYEEVVGKGNYDIYVPFLYRGWSLLNEENGVLGFIIPNKFFITDYAQQLRDKLVGWKAVLKIVDFTWEQVFPDPSIYSTVILLTKNNLFNSQDLQTPNNNSGIVPNNSNEEASLFAEGNLIFYQRVTDLSKWKLSPEDPVNPLEPTKIIIYGDQWYLLFKKEREFFTKMLSHNKLGLFAEIIVGLQTSADPVYILDYLTDTVDGIKVRSSYLEKKQDELLKKAESEGKSRNEIDEIRREYDPVLVLESEILKPVLKGKEIKRYLELTAFYRLVFPYKILLDNNTGDIISVRIQEDEMIHAFPKTYCYLLKAIDKLTKRDGASKLGEKEWFCFPYEKNLALFETPKIIYQVLASKASFTADLEGKFYFVGGGNAGGYGLILKSINNTQPSDEDYLELLAIMNSKPIDLFIKLGSSKFRGRFFSYGKKYIENIPIILNSEMKEELAQKAKQLIDLTTNFEREVQSFDSWVRTEVSVQKSFSISNYLELSKEEFIELIKKTEGDLGREKQALLSREFEETKLKLIALKRQILDIEKEIDEIVCQLYGLDAATDLEWINQHPFVITS